MTRVFTKDLLYRAALYWRNKWDTKAIAKKMKIEEKDVWNNLNAIKELVQSWEANRDHHV